MDKIFAMSCESFIYSLNFRTRIYSGQQRVSRAMEGMVLRW